jgi:hypothetical protein
MKRPLSVIVSNHGVASNGVKAAVDEVVCGAASADRWATASCFVIGVRSVVLRESHEAL